VYFSRPSDILAEHFNRLDGSTEYGSTYNPFWQARLVDTTIPERVIALLVQQKQLWVPDATLTLPFGLGDLELADILEAMGLT